MMKHLRSKSKAIVALVLTLTIAVTLVALPAVSAQDNWSIYITARSSDFRIRGEVRLNNVRQRETFTDIMLAVRTSGDTDWTYLGPFSTADGRVTYYYVPSVEGETYTFQYIVPPQGPLPTNPATADGKWYSDTVDLVFEMQLLYYSSYIYVSVSPRILGVGQQMLLTYWTAEMPPDIGEQSGAVSSPTGRAGWDGITMTVTRPDGTNETLKMPWSDAVGGGYIPYVPAQVGTYYLQAFFPETWKNTTLQAKYYPPAVSEPAAFTVQAEPIQPWQESPLPNDYWTRPINTASRDWYVLAGNWLGGAAQQWPTGAAGGTTELFAYGPGPESAHILWTMPHFAGGTMDERFGNLGYQTSHYGGISIGTPIILNGKILVRNRATSHTNRGWYVLDLYTGEKLLFDNVTSLPPFGSIYNYESPNQYGGMPYLWRTSGVTLPEGYTSRPGTQTWEMLDGYTFETITKIANVSAGGTAVYGKDGSILRYNTVNLGTTAAPNYYLTVWNSSAAVSMLAGATGTSAWQWRPNRRAVHNGDTMFSLNVSIPNIQGPRNPVLNQTASIRAVREGEYVIFATTGRNDERGIAPGWLMAVSLERGHEGEKLWETTFTPPYVEEWVTGGFGAGMSLTGVYPEDEVILFNENTQRIRWGYDMTTGELLWESEPEPQQNYYSIYVQALVYQGKLITTGPSGVIIAYDVRTGEVLWNYTAGFDFLSESPYGYSPLVISCIADGKIYTGHTFWGTNPPWRDYIRCINASNGVELWKTLFCARTSGVAGQLNIADGRLIGLNYNDNQIYCFGKGPSATTVTASPKVSVHGNSVLIEGTVTDQSPSGRRNTNGVLDFTLKGTPAISDEDMGAWMEYMFMQQAYPADAKGVEVTLDAIDPNGNWIHIGRATSDTTGAFGYAFEPEVPGTYQIIATFEGSKAYGPSFATTHITVEEAPPEPPPLEEPEEAPAYTAIDLAIIAAIVAVAILVVYTLYTVRKRT